jgi:hypothetical protein
MDADKARIRKKKFGRRRTQKIADKFISHSAESQISLPWMMPLVQSPRQPGGIVKPGA